MIKYINEEKCIISNNFIPELYDKKEDCYGCTACYCICKSNSVGAIIMESDELGFFYPVIDLSKCIGCKKCVNVCPVHKL